MLGKGKGMLVGREYIPHLESEFVVVGCCDDDRDGDCVMICMRR